MRTVDAQACQSTSRAVRLARHLTAALLLFFSAIATTPEFVRAAEQAQEFLNGLKQRGLNELALDYLRRMESSPLADEGFRRKIPYHRGVMLIEQSRQS